MIKTYKLFLKTNDEQKNILFAQSSVANKLYNNLLQLSKEELDFYSKNNVNQNFNPFNKYELRNQVPILKKNKGIYNTLYSSVSKNVAFRLANALSSFKRTKHFPKFRSLKVKGFYSLLYEEPFVGYKITNKGINISCGTTLDDNKKKRIKLELDFEKSFKIDKIKDSVRVVEIVYDKLHKKFALNIVVKLPDVESKAINKFIAFDPNHKNLMVGYDNNNNVIKFNNLNNIKISDKRIDKLKSKRDKCTKNSRRYNYLNNIIVNIYKIKRDQIKYYFRTISNYLCKRYDLIGIGDYVPSKSDIKNINRVVINQSNIGELRTTLNNICNRSGKTYYKYNEYRTTKTCHNCKTVGSSLNPAIRSWQCNSCFMKHDRDENSAKNGLTILSDVFKLPCSGYLVKARYTCHFNHRNIVEKQEIKNNNENVISKLCA